MHRKFYLFSAVGAIVLTSLLQSYQDGPAKNGVQATGAPGSSSNKCTTCHTGGSSSFGSVSIDLELKDEGGNVITEYIPETTYDVKVVVTSSQGSPSAYGFQMVALDDGNDDNAGDWDNESTNAQLRSLGGRKYIEHNHPSTTNEFTVEWTAPAAGVGDITFFLGANAVDDDGSNSGDVAKLDDFSFSEGAAPNDSLDGIWDVRESVEQLKLYPNPAYGTVTISGTGKATHAKIYSIGGKLIAEAKVENAQIDVSTLEPGYYVIRSEEHVGRFLKM